MYLHRFNDFGTDGGPAAKELAPKLAFVQKFLNSKLGEGSPKIDVRHLFSLVLFSLLSIFHYQLKSLFILL